MRIERRKLLGGGDRCRRCMLPLDEMGGRQRQIAEALRQPDLSPLD
jgi:hypothetical protein